METVNQSCTPTKPVLSESSLASAWLIVEVLTTALVALGPVELAMAVEYLLSTVLSKVTVQFWSEQPLPLQLELIDEVLQLAFGVVSKEQMLLPGK